MDELIQALKSPPKRKKPQTPNKRKRHPLLPRKSKFTSYSDWPISVPKEWRIKPRKTRPAGSGGSYPLNSDAENVRHLLSRAGFGGSVAEVAAMAATPIEDIVTDMLDASLPAPPGAWVDEPFDVQAFLDSTPEEQMAFFILNYERIMELRMWWLELMMASPLNLLEKMTFFWHGHFTTDEDSAFLAQFLYKQNDTLRRNALGNFRVFLKEIYRDPGMLLYLDGVSNIAAEPNENFARELLELFTMGVGNYTENDIKEIARAFTGWQIDPYNLTSFFNPTLHDWGQKTIFGQTGNFNGDDVIDLILDQPATAVHICRKLYEFFVSRTVDETFVNQLADAFRNSNYDIAPVMRELLVSAHFYGENARASLIKSPVELTVGNARMLSSQDVNVFFVIVVQELINQTLFVPPNVAGWPGQRSWINPTTYVFRNTISEIYVNEDFIVDPDTGEPYIRFDPLAFATSFGVNTAQELAEAMTAHLLRIQPNVATMEFLVTTLIGTADPNDWSLDYPGVDRLIRDFLIQVVRLPEFHLV